VRPELVLRTASHALVDETLKLFSFATRDATRRIKLLQSENQRIGTAPLRRYTDLVAQRQLVSALRNDPGMPASEVVALGRWVRQQQGSMRQSLKRKEQPQMLRALEAHCARQASASRAGFAILEGNVVQPSLRPGKGRPGSPLQVRLLAGGLLATPQLPTDALALKAELYKVGQTVRVRLESVDALHGRVEVELL
jgi:hypothetical protein